MAANRTRVRGRQILVTPTDGGVNSGDPLVVGQMPGVALYNLTGGQTVMDRGGVYNLSVKAADDAGNVAIAAGDILSYVTADTPKLSKKGFNPGGASGTTTVELTSAQSPASVAANTTAEQSLVVTGFVAGDVVVAVSKPTAQAGLGIVGVRLIDATHVGVTFSNNTGSPIVPTAAETYTCTVARKGGGATGVRFGYALAAVASGVTATIEVALGYDAS
jgi:predicted RecA/RadA family phage recombinase